MFRTIREVPSVIADYTVGTVIVLFQLRFRRATRRRSAAKAV
jgi:hypothetical protein